MDGASSVIDRVGRALVLRLSPLNIVVTGIEYGKAGTDGSSSKRGYWFGRGSRKDNAASKNK
jgi:hypothetical protein